VFILIPDDWGGGSLALGGTNIPVENLREEGGDRLDNCPDESHRRTLSPSSVQTINPWDNRRLEENIHQRGWYNRGSHHHPKTPQNPNKNNLRVSEGDLKPSDVFRGGCDALLRGRVSPPRLIQASGSFLKISWPGWRRKWGHRKERKQSAGQKSPRIKNAIRSTEEGEKKTPSEGSIPAGTQRRSSWALAGCDRPKKGQAL